MNNELGKFSINGNAHIFMRQMKIKSFTYFYKMEGIVFDSLDMTLLFQCKTAILLIRLYCFDVKPPNVLLTTCSPATFFPPLYYSPRIPSAELL